MRFRLGLATGMAIGYVLGTKAGPERHAQIMSAAETFRSSRTAQHLRDGLWGAWGAAKDEFAGEAVATVLDLHEKLNQPREA